MQICASTSKYSKQRLKSFKLGDFLKLLEEMFQKCNIKKWGTLLFICASTSKYSKQRFKSFKLGDFLKLLEAIFQKCNIIKKWGTLNLKTLNCPKMCSYWV